jgi:predicted nucleic acid-binding Zn ribbon protein
MIYLMECESCGMQSEILCRLEEHTLRVKPGYSCTNCGAHVRQIIGTPKVVFAREGFPKGDPGWEHATDEPTFIRDAVHLKDVMQQNGSISRYLEDKA